MNDELDLVRIIDREIRVKIKGKFGEIGSNIDVKIYDNGEPKDQFTLAQLSYTANVLLDVAKDMLLQVNNSLVLEETAAEKRKRKK